ncbi:MAG: hypothetical protein O2788_02655 [Chloroflexi bacterium]|nr:hypothetical protein [Chloroflexota bacterium]
MPIRILPNGTIEADSADEFVSAYELWAKVAKPLSAGHLPNRVTTQSYTEAFPAMWELWSDSVKLSLAWMLRSPMNGVTDSELKHHLGYTNEGNYQLAGTLQALGKVAKRFGFSYSDVVTKTNVSRGNKTKISYSLTDQTKQAMTKVKQPDLNKRN